MSALVGSVTSRTYEDTIQNVATSTTPASNTASVPTSTTELPENESACFYADAELCLLPNENDNCKECMPHPTVKNSLVCCNVTDIEKALSCLPNPSADNSSYWENIHIRNATLEELDISHKFWKRLNTFAVTDGQIKRVVKEFAKFSSPTCVNMSSNNLLTVTPRAFKDLPQLQILDISNNNLTALPNLNGISTNLTLDIR